jgi:AcrR family transcriptional regulator
VSTSTNKRGRARVPLSRARVVEAAIALADEIGLESLTMRKLGQALGVEAMALYNHVDNKGHLVDAMVDRVVGEIELPAEGDWRDAIRTCAVSAHDVFLRHPWACGPAMGPGNSREARTSRVAYIEWLLRRLTEAGFPPELTYRGYHALDSHILGFTMWQLGHSGAASAILARTDDAAEFAANLARELRASDLPHLAIHLEQHMEAPSDDSEREFEFGLDLILDGLERARDEAR